MRAKAPCHYQVVNASVSLNLPVQSDCSVYGDFEQLCIYVLASALLLWLQL